MFEPWLERFAESFNYSQLMLSFVVILY